MLHSLHEREYEDELASMKKWPSEVANDRTHYKEDAKSQHQYVKDTADESTGNRIRAILQLSLIRSLGIM